MLGQAKLALCFQIPSQASWHGIVKPHRSFGYANGPTMPRPEFSRKKHGVALDLQAGMCCEKASASLLASFFSITNPAFAQRINTMIFGLPIRVYLGNPWLKCVISGWQNHWSGKALVVLLRATRLRRDELGSADFSCIKLSKCDSF